MSNWRTIEELCDRHLAGRPSAAALAQMKPVENERPEVRDFVTRMFRLMNASGFEAKDFLPSQTLAIAKIIPGFLPGAWGGSIPPFTWEHRHKRIDAYLRSNRWRSFGPGATLLEMGCGFPPHTATDAARLHPDWQIVGADPCFDKYLLYDADGNYACLTSSGSVRYFHPGSDFAGGMFRLYDDMDATVRHFSSLFATLVSRFKGTDDGKLATSEANGARLIRNPLCQYERENLSFINARFGADVPKADILRSFNVLLYFDSRFRREAETWAASILNRDGLFICGVDSARSTDARYAVYRKEEGSLTFCEFAFSIDNFRPSTVMPWWSFHDDDQDALMLARLIRVVRSDTDFRAALAARSDELLEQEKLFVRDQEGNFQAAPVPLSPTQLNDARERIMSALEAEEFPERAAAVLRDSGISAWVNEVRHVAADPASI